MRQVVACKRDACGESWEGGSYRERKNGCETKRTCVHKNIIFFWLLLLSFYSHVNDPSSSKFLLTNIGTLLHFFAWTHLQPCLASCLGASSDHHAGSWESFKIGKEWGRLNVKRLSLCLCVSEAFPWSLCRNTVEIPTLRSACVQPAVLHIFAYGVTV